MSYDVRCHDLAIHFLENPTDKEVAELAQVIQDAIEDHILGLLIEENPPLMHIPNR